MKQYCFPTNWLIKLSIGYLLLPFIIFCLTFLKVWTGLPIAVLLGWITLRIWKQVDSTGEDFVISKRDLIIGLVVLGIWVVLSGIGGFAFQNLDFVYRNVVFKDLINFNWPVYYSETGILGASSTSALIYYIGDWLPAALVGKLSGWHVANIALFTWTLLGVFLTAVLLKERIKSSLFAASLLLIFFSGMDILGTLSIRSISPNFYPTIWPPIQHLEWWVSESFQFSSFTTQLFWAFNQAVPAWICIALILITKKPRIVFYLWALCFFCAPIPSVGMLPFTLLIIPRKAFNPENISFRLRLNNVKGFYMDCLADFKDAITPENLLGGGIVLLVSSLYFSANPNGSKISFLHMNALIFVFYIVFLLYEVILLWILFFHEKKNNLWWYVVGGSFVIIPLISIGNFPVFCTRASIPALFMLMVWSGEALFRKPHVKYRGALLLILLIGAFTPIYEINRSIYRTGVYYIYTLTHSEKYTIPQITNSSNILPEYSHPSTLTADIYQSSIFLEPDDLPNFVAKIDNSFFYKYLAPPP